MFNETIFYSINLLPVDQDKAIQIDEEERKHLSNTKHE